MLKHGVQIGGGGRVQGVKVKEFCRILMWGKNFLKFSQIFSFFLFFSRIFSKGGGGARSGGVVVDIFSI